VEVLRLEVQSEDVGEDAVQRRHDVPGAVAGQIGGRPQGRPPAGVGGASKFSAHTHCGRVVSAVGGALAPAGKANEAMLAQQLERRHDVGLAHFASRLQFGGSHRHPGPQRGDDLDRLSLVWQWLGR
jgi:hypothetical protein